MGSDRIKGARGVVGPWRELVGLVMLGGQGLQMLGQRIQMIPMVGQECTLLVEGCILKYTHKHIQ